MVIYTIEGNTSAGSTLVANGGAVAKKSYNHTYSNIAKIYRPKYNAGEAEKVCAEAYKYVGYLEKKSNTNLEDFTANAGSANYNMFAPHAKAQTGSSVYANGVAWCDIFADDMLIRALGAARAKQLIYDWSAYTPTSANYLAKAGATEITDFSKSTYGDIIFFKNSTRICHVGIVVTGYNNTPVVTVKPNTVLKATATKKGVQEYLNTYYGEEIKSVIGAKLVVDGAFGAKSKKALAVAFQKELNALGANLKIDGDFGTASQTAFDGKAGTLKLGSKGIFVTLWQCLLVGWGYDPNGIDGDFGSGCKSATNLLFKANALSQDSSVSGADVNKLI